MNVYKDHLADEALERYCLKHVHNEELDSLEDHLLVCEICRKRLDAVEQYCRLLAKGLQEYPRSSSERARPRARARAHMEWGDSFRPRGLAWVAGLAVASLLILGPAYLYNKQFAAGPTSAAAFEVTLVSQRGNDGFGSAPVGRPLYLHLDRTGLSGDSFEVEIVDSTGLRLWSGPPEAESSLSVRPAIRLEPGIYWIRLQVSGATVREFGLRVK